MTPAELQTFLNDQIPLTKALAVRVIEASEERVELRAKLEPNRNHLGTAFGGSLAAVAILAGYAWIFQALERRGHDVRVILKSSAIDYLKPVNEDLRAICLAPPAGELEKAIHLFEKKGVGRLRLNSSIEIAAGVACRLAGEFVFQKP